MLDTEFKRLVDTYNMNITGVIHIGAHYGEEIQTYLDCGIKEMLLFEPQLDVFEVLIKNIPDDEDGIIPFRMALGEHTMSTSMYVEKANKGQSSSLLRPKLHVQQYPHIQFNDKATVNVMPLDYVMESNKQNYNFINIDVQGYELNVFKGANKTFEHIDYIYSEVNRKELYEGCPMVEELDEYLKPFGFKRVDTNWVGISWGDALFVKENN